MSNNAIRFAGGLKTLSLGIHSLGIAEQVAAEREAKEYGRRCAMTMMPNTVAWVAGKEYRVADVVVTVHTKGGPTLQYAFDADGSVYTQINVRV